MNLLIFGAFPNRFLANDSLILKFRDQGHDVFFLNQCDSDVAAHLLESKGVPCFRLSGVPKSKMEWLIQIWKLTRFIKNHKIDVVFSHLDPSSLVAALSQYLHRARVIVVRHYVDDMHLSGQARSLSYRIIYKLAREIVVVSNRAREFMVRKEKVKASKIRVIYLLYDFSLYEQANMKVVDDLRSSTHGKLLLLTVCRLVKNKRPELAISVLDQLIRNGINAHLLIVGSGEMEEVLREMAITRQLDNACSIVGYKRNIIDYMEACDVFLNPSISEASSVVIKEAGLQQKPIIGCKGVGDCDEYIVHGENGYLVNPHNYVQETVEIISEQLMNADARSSIGKRLKESVLNRFDIHGNIDRYSFINESGRG